MDFVDAIAVVIACPFVFAVADGRVRARQAAITAPFIGVASRLRLRRARDVAVQRGFVSVFNHRKTDLTTRAPKRPDDRRTIICVGTVPFAFVGAAARRVFGIAMRVAFFPPHFERLHPFQ